VLSRIFGSKMDEIAGEWRRLRNEELYALYSPPDIIREKDQEEWDRRGM
jgi:hypothetical protein